MAPPSASPQEIVSRLGAVQTQDYGAAKWGIGLRGQGLVDAEVERAFNEGEIIRTHVLRPTWHFVAPADLRWLLQLTAPRIHLANGPRRARHRPHARRGRRLRCPAPRLPDDARGARWRRLQRAPAWKAAYLRARRRACAGCRIASLGSAATVMRVEAREYWAATIGEPRPATGRAAQLLPNYDEYFIGFRDRSAFLERLRTEKVPTPTPALERHVIAIGGQLAGGWKRTLSRKDVTVELDVVVSLSRPERQALTRAVEAYGAFLQLPVEIRT